MKKKNILYFVIFFALILGGLFAFHRIDYGERYSIYNSNDYYTSYMDYPLEQGKRYEQEFYAGNGKFNSFFLKYEIYQMGDYEWNVELAEADTGKVIQSWVQRPEDVPEELLTEYKITEELDENYDGKYKVAIWSDVNLPAVVLKGSGDDTLLDGEMFIDGVLSEGDISIVVTEVIKVYVTIFYGILEAIVLALFLTWLTVGRGYKKLLAFFRNLFGKIREHKRKAAFYLILMIVAVAGSFFGVKQFTPTFNKFYFYFISAALLAIICLAEGRNELKEHPERVFLKVFGIIGVLYVLVIPSGIEVGWDESIHYWSAVGASHATSGYANYGEAFLYWKSGLPFRLPGELDTLQSYHAMVQGVMEKNIGVASKISVLHSNKIFSFLVPGIFMKVARAVHLPYDLVFKFGALGNFTVYLLAFYLGMKKLRSGKMILLSVAAMGTGFFLSTVYSYDGFIIALSAMGLAYLYSFMQRKDIIKDREWMTALTVFTIGLLPKAIYVPLLLLFFFVQKKKFVTEKSYYRYCAAVVSCIATLGVTIIIDNLFVNIIFYALMNIFAYYFINAWVKMKKSVRICIVTGFLILCAGIGAVVILKIFPMVLGVGDLRGGSGVNSVLQLQKILEDPFRYLGVLGSFMFGTYLRTKSLFQNYSLFGYLGDAGIANLAFILMVIVVFTDKSRKDKWKRKTFMGISSIVLSLTSVALISTALYISYTRVGLHTVQGVQPRYMIPLVYPLIALIGPGFANKLLDNKNGRAVYHGVMILAHAALLLVGIWINVVARYAV